MKAKEVFAFIGIAILMFTVIYFTLFIFLPVLQVKFWVVVLIVSVITVLMLWASLVMVYVIANVSDRIKTKRRKHRRAEEDARKLKDLIDEQDKNLSYDAREGLAKQILTRELISKHKYHLETVISCAKRDIERQEKKIRECEEILNDYETVEEVASKTP
jgi:biopolymer transport protein ExbB/TolQ